MTSSRPLVGRGAATTAVTRLGVRSQGGSGQVSSERPLGEAVVQFRRRSGSKGARMLSWQQANQVANMASAQALAQLNVNLDAPRVDIAEAIHRAGITLMWQPLPKLFGAYLNQPGAEAGIIVNNRLPRGARRHTAAHELGHAWLDHTTSADDGSTINAALDGDPLPAANRRRVWSDKEKAAEAFAAWFLMPRRVVAAALRVLNLERPKTAEDVYRLSLLLGTSYLSTLRHLPNLRLASTQSCGDWARIAPGVLKGRLDAFAVQPGSRRLDVWQLTPRYDGLRLHLEPGDRIVLPSSGSARDAAGLDLPDWVRRVPRRTAETSRGSSSGVLEVAEFDDARECLLADPAGGWSVTLVAAPPPRGIDRLEL